METLTAAAVRRAARSLARRPRFAIIATLSLGLAISLNTTMYSVLDALINPRIAMRNPGQLYMVALFGDYRGRVSTEARNDLLRSGVNAFESVTGSSYRYSNALIETGRLNRVGGVLAVLPNYFTVLGVRPAAGRLFTDDDQFAMPQPAVIAERLAATLFSSGENAIGAHIQIQGETHVVIGVLDRASDFPGSTVLVWTPPAQGAAASTMRLGIARIRDGMSASDAEHDLRALSDRVAALIGGSPRETRYRLLPAVAVQFHLARFHLALIAAVIAVLLVACANLANLQLARGIARSRELATRAALGATRRDLVGHLMLDSVLLAAVGLVLGLVLTFWGMHLLAASVPESIGEYIVAPQTSWRLFAFAAGAAAVCVLLVGLLPAIHVSRLDLNDLIKRGAGTGSTRHARRQYGILIVVEIGFALVLVCGAALLVRAAREVEDVHHMWDQSKLTKGIVRVQPPAKSSWFVADITAELVPRLRGLVDVADVTVIVNVPNNDKEVTATDPGGAMHVVPAPLWSYSVVTPSYFRTMGMDIAHGRDFFEGEIGPVAIVDARTAHRLWPNTNAIGHMIKLGSPHTPGRWYTVVGVRSAIGIESSEMNDLKLGSVFALATPEDVLTGAEVTRKNPTIEIVIRSKRDAYRAAVLLRDALRGDSRFTLGYAGTFDQLDGTAVKRANRAFVGQLFTLFAIVAIALAALGVYGIVAHSVAERRREIGVRLALGSSARDVLRAVLREGNVFMLGGTALGLLLIRLSATLVSSFLSYPEGDVYSIELFVPAAMFVFVLAVIAALVPAIGATRINPVEALRCE